MYFEVDRIRKVGLEFEEDNEIYYEYIRFELLLEK